MPITLVQLKEVLSMLEERRDFFKKELSLYHNSDQDKCYKKSIAYYNKQIEKLSIKIDNYIPE